MAAAAAADADLDEGLETKGGRTLFLLGAVVVGEDGDSGDSAHTKLVVDEDGDSGDSARGGDPSRHAASPVDPGQFVHPISAF